MNFSNELDLSNNSRCEEVIQICNNLIEFNSSCERAYFQRAMAYFKMKNNSLALIDLENLLSLNPKDEELKKYCLEIIESLSLNYNIREEDLIYRIKY